MNYFKELSNEELKKFYLEDLNCLNKVIDIWYPHSLFDTEPWGWTDEDGIYTHIMRCRRILQNYLRNELSWAEDENGRELERSEKDKIAIEKSEQIFNMCRSDEEALYETANCKALHLSKKTTFYHVSENILIIKGEIAGRNFFGDIKKKFKKIFSK